MGFLILYVALPAQCAPQSKSLLDAGGVACESLSPDLISIHELQIPEGARAACVKGAVRFASKVRDSAGAIIEFQKAIKASPGYYEAYAMLGEAEVDLHQSTNAEAAFRKSIELSGGRYAPADFGLGLILATATAHLAEAETVVRSGIEIDPSDERGYFVLAWVLYSTARVQEAEESASEALSYRPNFAAAQLLLAQIHLRENRFAAVVKDLDAYLALGVGGPWDDRARMVRAEVTRVLASAGQHTEVADASK
jgi:tetratricopeptide (TPR) repeat protein